MIEQLRQATRTAHTQLDQTIYPIIQSTKTTQDYAELLHMFYGYFQPVYEKIDQFIDRNILTDYDQRRKPTAILKDLEKLNPPSAIHHPPSICPTTPAITDAPSAFGALYVLEGSTMGGAIITKKLKETTGLPDEHFTFFNGYGPNNHTMWARFIETLNQLPTSNLQHLTTNLQPSVTDSATKTATETFQHFYNWVLHCYPERMSHKASQQ